MIKKYENIKLLSSNAQIKGDFIITEDFIFFKPYDSDYKEMKEAIYRIVQTGFRKIAYLLPHKFYFKTMSGAVSYFFSLKSKKIVRDLENLIY